jgi:hypothetical protein
LRCERPSSFSVFLPYYLKGKYKRWPSIRPPCAECPCDVPRLCTTCTNMHEDEALLLLKTRPAIEHVLVIKERCAVPPVVVEVDRIVRPGGSIIVRDEAAAVGEVKKLLRSLHWDVRLTFSKDDQGVLYAEKSNWRPEALEEPS